jgi:hypothetical protein
MNLNLLTLTAHDLDAGPTRQPPTPIPPEDRCRPDGEGMQQDAHVARLDRGAPMPLTLLAQRTGTATVDAGSRDHAQTPIGFRTPLVQHERLSGRTAQSPIGLERNVTPREVVRFPGQSGSVALWRQGRGELLLLSWRTLGGAHGIRMQRMPHLQAQIPDPLKSVSHW